MILSKAQADFKKFMENLIKIELADFGNIFRSNPCGLTAQEFLSLDFILHRVWKHKRDGGQVHFGDKSWNFEAKTVLEKIFGELEHRESAKPHLYPHPPLY